MRILYVPDTQAGPGRDDRHMHWIGQFIVDEFAGDPDFALVHGGDHADMRSLSKHNTKLQMEKLRYDADIESANHSFNKMCEPFEYYNERCRMNKVRQWTFRKVITLGNHEMHIAKAVEENPQWEGFLSLDHLNYKQHGFEVHDFLDIVDVGGIWFSHYFYNPNSGIPYGGSIDNVLSKVGHSFIQGHKQGLYGPASRYVGPQRQRGIIAGSCYLHDEDYKGPQGNYHWRGILVLEEVNDGDFDFKDISLGTLCKRYEGITLEKYLEYK